MSPFFSKESLRNIGSQDLLRALITHTEDFIYIKDRHSRFLLTNMATAQLMGAQSIEELIGKTDFDFYPHEIASKYYQDEQEIVRTGQAVLNYEEPGVDAQGKKRYFFTTKVPLKDKTGKVTGIVGIGKDITARKQAEEILQRDKETLEKLAREMAQEIITIQLELEKAKRLSDIGTLAATVAHELRNPLAAIKIVLANISRKIKNPALDEYLSIIEKKIFESDQIINNLLFYSRIKPPHAEQTNLSALIKECLDVTQSKGKKEVVFVNGFDALGCVYIEADQIQIKEVFYNILNNAYDAVPAANGRIEIAVQDQGDHLCICIKDNGSGISKEDLQKVFDPFYTTKAKGTGLGLSVCQQIINLHGGTIRIESAEGKGATVIITLPKKAVRKEYKWLTNASL